MDIERLRSETPGCAHRVHLNNAGASLMPEPVLEAIRDHLDLEAHIGGYEAEAEASAEISEAYSAVAELLGTAPANVAFTDHATTSFTQALSSIPFRAGDVVLTTRSDYVSNQIQYLALAERFGVEVVRAPDAPEGGVDLQAMDEMIHRRRPRLVAVTHVPTSSGLVQDVATIGSMCRARDILYLVDACQSVGQMPIDVREICCTMASVTSRKFLRGPRGVGFLYIDLDFARGLEPILLDGRAANWVAPDRYELRPDARRFEEWESNIANRIGLGVAVDYALEVGLAPTYERIQALATQLRAGLEGMPGVTVADQGAERCGIVTFYVDGVAPAEVKAALRAQRINVNTIQPGDTLLDSQRRGLPELVRSSVHYYNSEDEVARLIEAVGRLV